MILGICFWIGKQFVMRSLKAQWRRDFYGFGGGAWTGRGR